MCGQDTENLTNWQCARRW